MKYLLTLYACFLSFLSNSQWVREVEYEKFLADFHLKTQSEFIDPEWVEDWEELLKNPLNLHLADSIQLLNLHILAPNQIHTLIYYRRRVKNFFSYYELANLFYWDTQLAKDLMLFTHIQPPDIQPTSKLLPSFRFENQSRFRYKNSTDSFNSGIPISMFFKQSFSISNAFKATLLLDHDAFEPFYVKRKIYGFDFYSGSFMWTPKKSILKKLIIGDFRLQIGEGLTMWNGFMFVGNVVNKAQRHSFFDVKEYKSTMESGFFRGVAASIALPHKWNLIAYASTIQKDAQISSDSTDSFSSFYQTGFHRKEIEIQKKNILRETSTGIACMKYGKRWKLGWGTYFYHWTQPWKPQNLLYAQHRFKGNLLLNSAINYSYILKNGWLAGEIASSSNGGIASIQQIRLNISHSLQLALITQYYNKKYFTPYGQMQRQAGNGVGEWSMRLMLSAEIAKGLNADFCVDYLKTDFMTYTIPEPFYKASFLHKWRWMPLKNFEASYQSEYAYTPYSIQLNFIKSTEYQHRWSHKFQAQFQPLSHVLLRSSIQLLSNIRHARWAHSIALGQFIQIHVPNWKLHVTLQYQYYSVPDFDLRLYQYEKSMSGMFENMMMNGEGHALSSYWKWKASKQIQLEWKIKYIPMKDKLNLAQWDLLFQCSFNLFKGKN